MAVSSYAGHKGELKSPHHSPNQHNEVIVPNAGAQTVTNVMVLDSILMASGSSNKPGIGYFKRSQTSFVVP